MIDKRIELISGASDSSRIPNWTTSARVNINGSFFCIVRNPGRYYEIRRNWKAKDSVKIVFDMPVRVVHANPHVREMTTIPYFAWANRGFSEMEVWNPRATKE